MSMRVPPDKRKRPAEFCDRMSEERRGEGNPMWGRKLTEEHVQKLKQSRSKPQPAWRKKQISESMKKYHAEHPRSEETRRMLSDAGRKSGGRYNHLKLLDVSMIKDKSPNEKRSESLRGRYCGIDHPNWKGGKSYEPYCPKFNNSFKKRVREFFGNRCVLCGKHRDELKINLHVHHVNYDRMVCCNNKPKLFVALCRGCHLTTNKDREKWEEYFTGLINTKYGGKCY